MALTCTQTSLSLEASQSCPLARVSSLYSLPKSSSPFLITLRIVRLVNSFRKRIGARINTRVPRKARPAKVRQDFCQAFERHASEEVDKYLGRKRRVPKDASGPIQDLIEDKSHVNKKLESLIGEVNQSVTSDRQTLCIIAKDNALFLNRTVDFDIERLSVAGLAQLLATTRDLLETLKAARPRSNNISAIVEGDEHLDLRLDETYLANLEHLLLCLLDCLLRLLVAEYVKALCQHYFDCQEDQRRNSENWFSVFPDSQHPLSTTWPWSIRPSLAVLWGVCWMFYDHDNTSQFDDQGNAIDAQGNIIVPRSIVQLYAAQMQRRTQQRSPVAGPPGLHANFQPSLGSAFPVEALRPYDSFSSAPPDPGFSLAESFTNYAASAAPPSSEHFLPQVSSALRTNLDSAYACPHEAYSENEALWLPRTPAAQQSRSSPRQSLPPSQNRQNRLTPTIVNVDIAAFSEPQDAYYSASSQSSAHLQEGYNDYHYGRNLSPRYHPTMAATLQQPPAHEHLQAPVSPVSAQHSPREASLAMALADAATRKRSHDQMSQGYHDPESARRSREPSAGPLTSASPGAEDYSPRGSRSHKRPDPPVNEQHKYFCDHSAECAGLTFDRKCEWSKHMDKHDRPYRCLHPDCAKLQGFTYSGGLLRHEREVHGKHGGPKDKLICPHEDCKRHTGKGFTRKENLNEHIRRVHDNKSEQPSQPQQLHQQMQAPDAVMGADQLVAEVAPPMPLQTPYADVSHPYADAPPPPLSEMTDEAQHTAKRQRTGVEDEPSADIDELRDEIRRLRDESASKDDRLRRMELVEAHLQTEMQRMREALDRLQQVQPFEQLETQAQTNGDVQG